MPVPLSTPPAPVSKLKSKHRLYKLYHDMKGRCRNPKHHAFKYYGGRGIAVSQEWLSFEKFLEDMEPTYREGLTLERRDNSVGYCASNCYWASWLEQLNNTRYNRWIEANGERHTVSQWARILGVHVSIVNSRLQYGWEPVHAVTFPVVKGLSYAQHKLRNGIST